MLLGRPRAWGRVALPPCVNEATPEPREGGAPRPAPRTCPGRRCRSEWTRGPFSAPLPLRCPRRSVCFLVTSLSPPPRRPLREAQPPRFREIRAGGFGTDRGAAAEQERAGAAAPGRGCALERPEPRPGLVTCHPSLSGGTRARPRLGLEDADAGFSAPRGVEELGWHLASSQAPST